MRSFPKKALPVLEEIRKKVPRPINLPYRFESSVYLEGNKYIYRWWHDQSMDRKICCPMGLLPNALLGEPSFKQHFRLMDFEENEISAFASWWDRIGTRADMLEAVEFIWGKSNGQRRKRKKAKIS